MSAAGSTNAERLRRLGLYDPEAPDADERLRLLELILALGPTEDELVERGESERLGPLALELAMRGSTRNVEFADAASQAGLSIDEAAGLWRALGFPDPRQTEPRLSGDSV